MSTARKSSKVISAARGSVMAPPICIVLSGGSTTGPPPRQAQGQLRLQVESSGARDLEKDTLQSLVGCGARPDDILKCLIVAFAGLKRAVEHDLDLLARRLKTARQKQSLAEHDHAFPLPMVEVAEQHLLVDERYEAHHLQLATSRNLEIESAGNVQRLEFLHPGKRNLVVGPGARDRDRNLVVAVALEAPVVRACDMLDDIHRMTVSGY